MFNGKKNYSSNVNNQILEQIYMDMLEKLKKEACSVQEQLFWKANTCVNLLDDGRTLFLELF